MILEDKLQRLLQDLGEALVEAISDSSEMNESLRALQKAGYSLYLVVDCKRGQENSKKGKKAVRGLNASSAREPVFRIDGKDLLFLRSIGIDPTRKSRGRR